MDKWPGLVQTTYPDDSHFATLIGVLDKYLIAYLCGQRHITSFGGSP
jgi:hypothetical protein